jgi:hypothetical protein
MNKKIMRLIKLKANVDYKVARVNTHYRVFLFNLNKNNMDV